MVFAFRRRAAFAWGAMLTAAVFRLVWALSSAHAAAYLHYSFPGTMDSVAAGCLLAIYEPKLRERFRWMAESPAIAITVPATAWILDIALWGGNLSTAAVRSISVLWGAVPILIACSIFLLVERRDWILNNWLASAIGVLSYSLYLWQQPFTVELHYSRWLSIVAAITCAIASYFLIEKPMLALGASMRRRRRPLVASHESRKPQALVEPLPQD
jgi:peptidoglycan/LPS O-acetylase OafA/YrhL